MAQRAGVSVKAVRYYEEQGLVTPGRRENGYREFDEADARLVREVHALSELGIRVDRTRPFLECLIAGHDRADDCPDSIAAYRDALTELDARVAQLSERRAALAALLDDALDRAQSCGCAPTEGD